MEEKLLKFDEVLDYLRDAVSELENWQVEYNDNGFNEIHVKINELNYIVSYLESYQDYLIEESGEKL